MATVIFLCARRGFFFVVSSCFVLFAMVARVARIQCSHQAFVMTNKNDRHNDNVADAEDARLHTACVCRKPSSKAERASKTQGVDSFAGLTFLCAASTVNMHWTARQHSNGTSTLADWQKQR
jgi:hypothetical protein